MPLFEFVCTNCNHLFEELVRSSNSTDEMTCPDCGSSQVEKKISTFASRISLGSSASYSSGSISSCAPSGT